jgi:hypothetical protein
VLRRRAKQSKAKRDTAKVPWLTLLQVGLIVGKRWAALSEKERVRLTELLRQSRGRVGNLSARQRIELRKLARKADLKGMSRELAALVSATRARRRRRHR